jgi:hypothetical protein
MARCILARRRAFLLDALAHPVDFAQPSGRVSGHAGRRGEIGQRGRQPLKARACLQVSGHGPDARQRLDFPQRRPPPIILLARFERVDQQTFFPVRPQARVGLKNRALLRPRREQIHQFGRQRLQARQIGRRGRRSRT